MTTKLYVDWISQPSRAVVTFCLIEKIPHEIVEVRIKNLENQTQEYKQISPQGKVPAMSDTLEKGKSFNLVESHAIMRYLSDKHNKSNLYPKANIQLKAKTDSYLDWHHQNTRKCGAYLFDTYFSKALGVKQQFNPETLLKDVDASFRWIEKYWLDGGKNEYIGNNQQLTIADISCYCEIAEMKIDQYDIKSKYPILYQWMLRMEKIPEIQKTHEVFFKLVPKMKQNNLNPKL